jgi:chromosome segregation ATPase
MKKLFAIGLAVLPFLFTSCAGDDSKNSGYTDSLQTVISQKDAEIDALFEVLSDIENNLTEISSRYSQISALRQQNPEKNANVKGEITDQLAVIESIMTQNKEKIAKLNAQISNLKSENNKLQEFIESLNSRMAEQETQINNLTQELSISKETIHKLSANVSELKQSNQDKDKTIAQQNAEMEYLNDQSHRAYYVVGTYDELKEKGIVNKEGGLIFKQQHATSNVNAKNFNLIDRNKVTTIDINLRKARLISSHPKDSYEIIYDDSDSKLARQLVIKDVNKFWSNTDFLIISTKR